MEAYQRRMIAEYEELSEKVVKLGDFLRTSTYDALTPREKHLMAEQLSGMEVYSNALQVRMDDAELFRESNTVEDLCGDLRGEIEVTKGRLAKILDTKGFAELPNVFLDGANIPIGMQANIAANITLAFRHLEDARMRLGKAMQAYQGGISIFDRGDAINPNA